MSVAEETSILDLLNKAIDAHQKDKFNKAKKLYKQVLEADPNQFEALQYLGMIHYAEDRSHSAIELLDRAVALEPQEANVFLNRANVLVDLDRDEDAIEDCLKAISLEPDYTQAHILLGDLYTDEEENLDAIYHYKKALTLDITLSEVHNNIANAYHAEDQSEYAVYHYKEALELNPDLGEAYNGLGVIAREDEDYESALQYYAKAIELSPDLAPAWNGFGATLYDQDEYNEEIPEYYKKALSLQEDYCEARCNLGNYYHNLGEYQNAKVCFLDALEYDETDPDTHAYLANTYHELEDVENAIKHYKLAVECDEDHSHAAHMLASLTGTATDKAPDDYVEELFDSYASNFENSLLNDLSYQTPSRLKPLVEKHCELNAQDKVLDLGCGTGLMGLQLEQFNLVIDGIDLSNNMLKAARDKEVYRDLIQGDLVSYIDDTKEDYNLFIAADVIIYLGTLDPLFTALREYANRLNKPCKFIFTTETMTAEETELGNPFHLRSSGRYSHGKPYIQSLIDKHDVKEVYFEENTLRMEKDEWIMGDLYVLQF